MKYGSLDLRQQSINKFPAYILFSEKSKAYESNWDQDLYMRMM